MDVKTNKTSKTCQFFHQQGKTSLPGVFVFYLWETPGCSREEWGGNHFFSTQESVQVSSAEYRVHIAMMEEWKRGWRQKTKKACQESLMCNLFCLSLFIYCFLSLHPAFHISICCYFCIFLCSSVFLVFPSFLSLSLSLSVSFWLSGLWGRWDKPSPALM